jgi:hypothetical protein
LTELTIEELERRVAVYREHGSERKAAEALGISKTGMHKSLERAAAKGLLGTKPVLPGFRLSKSTAVTDADGIVVREFIQQRPDTGPSFEMPAGHSVKGVSALVDGSGRTIQQWVKTNAGDAAREAAFRAMVDALKEDLPRMTPTVAPPLLVADKMNQFIVTDSHFGMLAWAEETGADYDLRIAEQLLLDWFAAAIAGAPAAHTAVLAQLGDLMHHDALESVTPAHHHVLDADSRLQKIVRVVIRTIRRAIGMLLARHQHLHVVMASGNHDPAGSVWLREMLAVMYEDEPRITIDTSPALYHKFVWGKTVNFFHHGHKADIKTIDKKVAGEFRAEYGAADYAYAHIGHKHSDEGVKTELMYVERHETLAGRDAYAASGPWAKSGRSAKRITYDKRFGEVDRSRMTPEMVAGAYVAQKYTAANDNTPRAAAA